MAKSPRIWVVLADGSRAAVYSTSRIGGPLEPQWQDDSPEARKSTGDLGTDRPGRSQESADGARHGMSPPTDWHRQAEEAFLRSVMDRLVEDDKQEAFDRLVLVAPPKAIGVLRGFLPPALKSKVHAELAKDYLQVPAHDLPGMLESALLG